MKKLAIIAIACFLISCDQDHKQAVDYVDPFIGTGAHGHTYPGPSAPFGMIQPGPVNGTSGWDWTSGYHYSDSVITGFAQTHLSGTGIGDLNDILIMPWHGEYDLFAESDIEGKRNYASTFSHENEKAEAGYYSVVLDRHKIKVEMTATDRVALYRFTYPETENNKLVVDLGFSLNWDTMKEAKIQSEGKFKLSGWRYSQGWARNQKLHFVIESNTSFELNEANDSDRYSISFSGGIDEISLKIAISAVSTEGALANLETLETWDFDSVRNEASQLWNEALSQIQTKGDPEKLTKFYTALYRTKLAPILFSDIDGGFRGGNDSLYAYAEQDRYTIYSLWDTFRAQHPLLTITD